MRLPSRRRIGANLLELAHACQRISQEYHEIGSAQHGGTRLYHSLVYVHPMQARDRDRFLRAFAKAVGAPVDDDAPVAVPHLNGAFMCTVDTASAEHATMMLLTLVREASQDCGLTFDEVRTEAVAGPDQVRHA